MSEQTFKSGNPVRFCGNRNIDLGELQTEENPGRVQRPKTILDDYDDRWHWLWIEVDDGGGDDEMVIMATMIVALTMKIYVITENDIKVISSIVLFDKKKKCTFWSKEFCTSSVCITDRKICALLRISCELWLCISWEFWLYFVSVTQGILRLWPTFGSSARSQSPTIL